MRHIYLFIIGILLMACEQPQQESDTQAAAHCLEAAEVALANDSIRQGETLLRKAIHLAEASEDWHTYYIERNYVILLDYAGTYAAQVAYAKEKSFDEALDFIHRACDIAKEKLHIFIVSLPTIYNCNWLMTSFALNNLWTYLQGLSLSQSDREWLANKLIMPKETVSELTEEERKARFLRLAGSWSDAEGSRLETESYMSSIAIQLASREGKLSQAIEAFKSQELTPINFLLKDVAVPTDYDESLK